jgi:hypothetical protein
MATRTLAVVALCLLCTGASAGRQLLGSSDPGSPEAGVQYFTSQIVTGVEYLKEGLKAVDENYDFPTDGVLNRKVLQDKAGKLFKEASILAERAEETYPDPVFPLPNSTVTFWSGSLPKDTTTATWVGLLATGKGLAMVANSTKSVVQYPQLVAEAINAGLAPEIKAVAVSTLALIKDIINALGVDTSTPAPAPATPAAEADPLPESMFAPIPTAEEIVTDMAAPVLVSIDGNNLPGDVEVAAAPVVELAKPAIDAAVTALLPAGRKLLAEKEEEDDKSKCDIDYLLVYESDIDEVSHCTYADVVASLQDMDKTTEEALGKMDVETQEVWETVTGGTGEKCSEVNYKGTATGELLDYLRDYDTMRPCTDYGCRECSQPKSEKEGSEIELDDCSMLGDDKQQWKYVDPDMPGVDMFQIKNDEADMCLAGDGKKGSKVYLAKCKQPAGESQTFQVKEVESQGLFRDPYYSLKHAASGLCVGLEKEDDDEGTRFVLDDCKCKPSQVFKADD